MLYRTLIFACLLIYPFLHHAQNPEQGGQFLADPQDFTHPQGPYCHTDGYFAHRAAQSTHLARDREAHDRHLYEFLSNGYQDVGRTVLTIPTVVHIIHNNGPENIANSVVQDAIDHVNQAFRNLGVFDPNTGVDVEIELCLAIRDPNGNATDGINRVQSLLTDFFLETQDLDVKNLSRWDPTQYLNIWVVDEISSVYTGAGVAGYSTFPSSHGQNTDGFVVEALYFGTNTNNSKVAVHELGHYLGLYHTFQGGCTNNDCLQDGDKVCDTPPDGSTAAVACTASPNTCTTDEDDTSTNNPFRPVAQGGLGDQPDLFQDYMDYGDLPCANTFTQGQRDRMRLSLQTTRQSLLQSLGCTSPCTQPVVANFTTTATTVSFGATLNFTNTSFGATTYDWQINGQSFSSSPNASYTFNTLGQQQITLVASNSSPGCIDQLSLTIEVTCPAQASFTTPAGVAQPGQSVQFLNTSTAASSYTWLVDGTTAGSGFNLSYTFPMAGIYQVQLVASDGSCTDTSSLAYQVGFCTDRSNEQWRFGVEAGIDFSSGNAIVVNTSNMTAFENSAAVADQNGDLLFYTNSGGISTVPTIQGGVWNRNNQRMPNGTFQVSDFGCTSASQGAIILQNPANADQYYLFVTSCFEDNFNPGFAYHLIDMTLDNGLGDVAVKNQFISNNRNESMAAVRHCNGQDWWIGIINGTLDRYEFYLLTTNGISPTPVTTYSWNIGGANLNRMKFSPDGNFLASAYIEFQGNPALAIQLYNFDNATGNVTFKETLPFAPGDFFGGYEFSSNSQYLFSMAREVGASNWDLRQYDLTAPVVASTENLTTTLPPLSASPRELQLAPDGKIYVCYSNDIFLGTIDFPNQPMASLQPLGLQLASGTQTRSGLVNVPASSFHDPYPTISGPVQVCATNPETYTLDFDPCGTNGVLWDYRGSGQLGTTTDSTAVVTFGGGGTDTLIATKLADCSNLSDTFLITVGTGVPLSLGPDPQLCGGAATLDAGPGFVSYLWSTNASTQSITVSNPGIYWVEVTDANGCTERDSVEAIGLPAPPNPDLGPDGRLCGGAVVVLDPGIGFVTYVWQDNTTDSSYTAFTPGTYIVTVTDTCGQTGTDTLILEACVGVEDAFLASPLEIFPNPNQGVFHLGAEFRARVRDLEVEVYDARGKLLYREPVALQGKQLSSEVDLGEVAKGVYLLRLQGQGFSRSEQVLVD